LGLVAQQVWARDPDDVGKRGRRKQLPISQKESQKWLTSLEAVVGAHAECPQTRFVSIGDRAADVDDLLAAARLRRRAVGLAAWAAVFVPEPPGALVEQLLLQVLSGVRRGGLLGCGTCRCGLSGAQLSEWLLLTTVPWTVSRTPSNASACRWERGLAPILSGCRSKRAS
jgi:hypothetical protein